MKTAEHLAKITAELLPGEEIIASVNAVQTTTASSASGTIRGALVLTDRRLMFSGNSWPWSKTTVSTPLRQVTSVDLHTNMLSAHLEVTAATILQRYLVKYAEADPFAQAAHRQMYLINEETAS